MESFKQMLDSLVASGSRCHMAVVWPEDHTTRQAAIDAADAGFANIIFIGCHELVASDPAIIDVKDHVTVIEAANPDEAAATAVAMVRQGRANVIMKGMINTDNLLRAILDRDTGILPRGTVMTHITVAEIPLYHKLLCCTDVAVIPYPTDEQRHAQIRYSLDFCRKMGVDCPRLALIHCSEKVDTRHFPFTADYVEICEMATDGAFGRCIIDGPLDVKTACDPDALAKKGMTSPVNGDADILVFPDIEAGNVFYKTISLFADATPAGMLCGPAAPVVLGSRGDSVKAKFNSILIACCHAL